MFKENEKIVCISNDKLTYKDENGIEYVDSSPTKLIVGKIYTVHSIIYNTIVLKETFNLKNGSYKGFNKVCFKSLSTIRKEKINKLINKLMVRDTKFIYDTEKDYGDVFKNGEKIVCVDVDEFYYSNTSTHTRILESTIGELVLGKIYTVEPIYMVSGFDAPLIAKNVLYIHLVGITGAYHILRFKSLGTIRKEKINKLINGK